MIKVNLYSKGLKKRLKRKILESPADFAVCDLGYSPPGDNVSHFKFAFSAEVQSLFLSEYTNVIGSIRVIGNDVYWYATDIYSKNRFSSPFPSLLEQLFKLSYFFEHCIKNQIAKPVVINLDPRLFKVVKAYLQLRQVVVVSEQRAIFKEHLALVSLWRRVGVFKHLFSFWRRKREVEGLQIKVDDTKEYYVIKSFTFNQSAEGKDYQDPFFPLLPGWLKEQGQAVLVLTHIQGDFKKILNDIKTYNHRQVVPFEYFLSTPGLIKAALKLFLKRVRIKTDCNFRGFEIRSLLNRQLMLTGNGIKYPQFLFYHVAQKMVKDLNVKTLLHTYEHNPWETMLIKGAREVSPNTRIIGYQHNVIPRASANMFPSQFEDKALYPDCILTTGKKTKLIIEKHSTLPLRLKEACALRYGYLFDIKPVKKLKGTRTIVVALEGIHKAYKLINYVIKQLGSFTEWNVRFRFHPVLGYEGFQEFLSRDLNDFSHFSISSIPSVLEDISDSDIVIYWGSTVALEALSMGKPVIHYDMGELVNYDPLFECSHYKFIVREEDALVDQCKRIFNMKAEQRNNHLRKASSYLRTYFFPNTKENLAVFLKQ